MRGPSVYRRAIAQLGQALLHSAPNLALTRSGAVDDWTKNLLPDSNTAWFKSELDQGDGRELDVKFRAAHSSSALAVNNFARFKTQVNCLSLAGFSDFERFRFEAKCSAGIVGRRAPNLDLLLESKAKIVGIESKCTEHLRRHTAKFSPAYDEQITDARRKTAWFQLMQMLVREPTRYRYVDAAQLVKHAFGLGRCFAGQDVTLLYIFWEPSNAIEIPELTEHRAEIERLTADVAGSFPTFRSLSYRDLWNSWGNSHSPVWLPQHLSALRRRYDLAI